MARQKTKPSKVLEDAGHASSGDVPSFDENALSALTAKIEKGFGGSKRHQPGELTRGSSSKEINPHKEAKAKPKSSSSEVTRGTKRDIRGNAKAAMGGASSMEGDNGKADDDRAVLLKEILALGGTEEDLDLVVDAVSDEEGNDTNTPLLDKSFRKELANFVAGLGIEGELVEVASGDNFKEDLRDDWEDASNMDGSADSDGGEHVQTMTTSSLHRPIPEGPKRLVSTISVGIIGLTDSH